MKVGQLHVCGAQNQLVKVGLGSLASGFLSLPARADVSNTLQEGSALIQKDTVISVAFTVAVIALGAVSLGVRVLQ
jgi:hypothetical protein